MEVRSNTSQQICKVCIRFRDLDDQHIDGSVQSAQLEHRQRREGPKIVPSEVLLDRFSARCGLSDENRCVCERSATANAPNESLTIATEAPSAGGVVPNASRRYSSAASHARSGCRGRTGTRSSSKVPRGQSRTSTSGATLQQGAVQLLRSRSIRGCSTSRDRGRRRRLTRTGGPPDG